MCVYFQCVQSLAMRGVKCNEGGKCKSPILGGKIISREAAPPPPPQTLLVNKCVHMCMCIRL